MGKLVSPGGALPRVFRLPLEPLCLRPPEGGDVRIFFLSWQWTSVSPAFSAFKAFASTLALGGAGASFCTLGSIFMKKQESLSQ